MAGMSGREGVAARRSQRLSKNASVAVAGFSKASVRDADVSGKRQEQYQSIFNPLVSG